MSGRHIGWAGSDLGSDATIAKLTEQLATVESTIRSIQFLAANWRKKFDSPEKALAEIATALVEALREAGPRE